MTRRRALLASRSASVLLCACLASCTLLGPKPDPTRNFLLSPAPAGVRPAGEPAGAGPSIGVGPIELPSYLDRAAIAMRVGPNSLRFSERNRWAEPLPDNFRRVFAANLANSVATDEILVFPWYGDPQLDYRITVDVEQLDHSPGDAATLVARWTLRRGADGPLLRTARSTHRQPIAERSAAAAVGALSKVTADLAREIAAAIAASAD